MKAVILLLCLSLIHLAAADTEICYNAKEECHSTNYQTYVECVRRRQKRSTDCYSGCESNNCIDTCDECDCSSCNYSNCHSSCNNCCSSCCSNYVPCHTNHCCHKTCHAQCSTSSCRSSCRKSCFDTVKEKTESKVERERAREIATGNTYSNITNLNRHNVTTIIHLNNVINNTNIIDVPIVVNNTNSQNITLYNEQRGVGESGSLTERCCTVISPRQCVSTPQPRCFHYRSKQCGPFCTADIVHKEEQQLCQSNYPGAPPKCTQQVIYIPQPKPRCSYQSVWPYVSCGIQKQETCQGCYSHYLNPQSTNYLGCPSQCYDDGYGLGSIYRKGPVYRPGYSHSTCYNCLDYQSPYNAAGYQSIPYGAYTGIQPGAYPGYQDGGYSLYPQFQNYPYFSQTNQNATIPVLKIGSYNPLLEQAGGVEIQPGQQTDLSPPAQYYDGRLPREVEIEVKYEPSSNAQAEVKIKKEDSEIVPVMEIDKNDDIIDTDKNSTIKG